MGIINSDTVAAYRVNNQILCPSCYKEMEEPKGLHDSDLTEEMTVDQATIDYSDDLYFCDNCKKQIK